MNLRTSDDTIFVSNAMGVFHFDRACGYVKRFVERDHGQTIIEDNRMRGDDPNCPLHLNDPRAGGFGSFGCHVVRENWIGETNTRMISNDEGWGQFAGTASAKQTSEAVVIHHACQLFDPWVALFTLERHYVFTDAYVQLIVTAHEHGEENVFIKEPKINVGICAPYQTARHYDARDSELAHRDLTRLPDPWKGTWQLRSPDRFRLHFTSWDQTIDPRARIARGLHLLGDCRGFDTWTNDANGRARFRDDCAKYCLQGPPSGGLTRAWEVAKRRNEPHIGIMYHVWEGGTGASDCLCAARASRQATWRMRIALSYGAGWRKILWGRSAT